MNTNIFYLYFLLSITTTAFSMKENTSAQSKQLSSLSMNINESKESKSWIPERNISASESFCAIISVSEFGTMRDVRKMSGSGRDQNEGSPLDHYIYSNQDTHQIQDLIVRESPLMHKNQPKNEVMRESPLMHENFSAQAFSPVENTTNTTESKESGSTKWRRLAAQSQK